MPTNTLRASATAALLSIVMSIATPVFAQSELAKDAKYRINLSGSLRMLSQRIAQAGCLVYSEVDVEQNLAVMLKTEADFAQRLNVLRSGDPDLGIPMEVDLNILAALGEVDQKWAPYSRLVKDVIVSRTLDGSILLELDEAGDALLESMVSVTSQISQTYGEKVEDLPLILAVTIDFAGRQRMLTQKMSKQFCLIDAGVDIAGNQSRLSETLGVYNATLSGLVNGYPGVLLASPNAEISSKLDEVSAVWQSGNETFTSIAAGSEITDANRAVVETDVKMALSLMNDAVKMYEMVDIHE